jgi:hypothetical protein
MPSLNETRKVITVCIAAVPLSRNVAQLPRILGRMDEMEAATATHAKQQPADDAKLRDAQRARLRQLRDELVAEGADGTKLLPQVQARADTWPE